MTEEVGPLIDTPPTADIMISSIKTKSVRVPKTRMRGVVGVAGRGWAQMGKAMSGILLGPERPKLDQRHPVLLFVLAVIAGLVAIGMLALSFMVGAW